MVSNHQPFSSRVRSVRTSKHADSRAMHTDRPFSDLHEGMCTKSWVATHLTNTSCIIMHCSHSGLVMRFIALFYSHVTQLVIPMINLILWSLAIIIYHYYSVIICFFSSNRKSLHNTKNMITAKHQFIL